MRALRLHPTWPEGDVQLLWLDLSDVLCGPRGLVAEGPVLDHLQFAGWRLQFGRSTACRHQVTLQIAAGGTSNTLAEVLAADAEGFTLNSNRCPAKISSGRPLSCEKKNL